MIKKDIVFFGQKAVVACDGKCEKAWGINNRPKVLLSDDEDDYAFLADNELGEAPENSGTYEGGNAKPRKEEEKLNKWCVRECERNYLSGPEEYDKPIVLKDYNKRVFNKYWRQETNN